MLGAVQQPPSTLPLPSRKHMESYLKTWQPKVQHLLPKPKPAEKPMEEEVTESTPLHTVAVEHLLQQDQHSEAPVEEEVVEAEPTPEPQPEPPRISKRRERLLQLARQNARTPLPESVKIRTPEEEAQRRAAFEEQKEQEKRTKETVRDRLWKLMGGGGGGWL